MPSTLGAEWLGGPIQHWVLLSEKVLAHAVRSTIVNSFLRVGMSNQQYVLPHVVRKRSLQKMVEVAVRRSGGGGAAEAGANSTSSALELAHSLVKVRQWFVAR